MRNPFSLAKRLVGPKGRASALAPPQGGLWKAACDLVDRARAGDQNAMAMLAQVGNNARAGQPRAKMTASMIYRYIHERPADAMGADTPAGPQVTKKCLAALSDGDRLIPALIAAIRCSCGQEAAIVVLANGPHKLTDSTVREWGLSCFGNDESTDKFFWGIRLAPSDPIDLDAAVVQAGAQGQAFQIGRTIGAARAIQAVRLGHPIALLSTAAAWELGEAA